MIKTFIIEKQRPVNVNYRNVILVNNKKQKEIDPTRTVILRRAFVRDMDKRFNKLAKEVIDAIVNKDVFGLVEPVRVFTDLGEKQFKFKTSQQKVEGFMEWFREREKAGILKTTTINQLGTSIEQPWTNVYIEDSYKRGVMRATAEAKKIKVPMPGMTDEPLQATMANPFHAERVGVLYSRAFGELKGITSNMDQQISRVLSEGLVNGDNPRLLARKLNKVITGAGGDLSLKDSLGRFIPAKRRAEMLARTEIIRAHHQATIQQYRNYGIAGVKVKAEWSTAGDNRVCPECEKLERKVFTLDEIQGMIPVHPNCRCLALPSLVEVKTGKK